MSAIHHANYVLGLRGHQGSTEMYFATPLRTRSAFMRRLTTCTGECWPGLTYENRTDLENEYNNGPSRGLQAERNSKPLPGNNLSMAKNYARFLRRNVSCAITASKVNRVIHFNFCAARSAANSRQHLHWVYAPDYRLSPLRGANASYHTPDVPYNP